MKASLRDLTFRVWLLLVLATIVSWWLGTDHGTSDRELATLIVLSVAFVKVRYVGLDFMHLRHAPLPLRVIFELYVLVIYAAVVGVYLTS